MANYSQITSLTAQARTDFNAGLGIKHAEFWVISWPTTLADGSPSGDEETVYGWTTPQTDSIYLTPFTTWLAGRPYVVTFASNGSGLFTELNEALDFSDKTASATFSNDGREIERLINVHNAGVKVEIFDFYPLIDGGTAYSRFLGTLQTPNSIGDITQGFVRLSAISGIASAEMVVPHLRHSQQCEVLFGGEQTFEQLKLKPPCSYNRHLTGGEQTTLGGAKGLLNGASPFPTCPHTEAGCIQRFGHKLVFMGLKPVVSTEAVGLGEHKTYSVTTGRDGTMGEPAAVVFGDRVVSGVKVDHRKEVNPSPSNADAGTLVTLFEFSLGPVESMSDFELMERTPQGIDYRLGTQEQSPTVFITDAPSLNRRAHANLNHNPIDPSTVQTEQMKATCHMEGYITRAYSDVDTFTESWTNGRNRAWATYEIISNQWWGLGIDRSRLTFADFLYWAGKNSSFDCQLQSRSAQQQLADIFEAGRAYPLFYKNGQWRLIPIETLDLTAGDIPTFTDTGTGANIIVNKETGVSTVEPLPLNLGKIPNDIYLHFEDGSHKNIMRPLHFPDFSAQRRAGRIYGDNTLRPIPKQYAAMGITSLTEAVPLGAFLRDLGSFGRGGLQNPCKVRFVTKPAHHADAQELHLGRAIFIVSDNLDPTIYTDPQGNPYEAWIVDELQYTSEADLIVTCVAYGKYFYDTECAPSSGYVTWTGSSIAIDGANGADTKLLTASPTLGASSFTYSSSIDANDVIVSRWIHTIDALPGANSYNVWHGTANIGYKIWHDGSGWIYHGSGIDTTTFTAGTLGATDTLSVEFDKNGGSPVRYYKHNGTTVRTDSTGVTALNEIDATGFVTDGMQIGDIFWEVFPCGCTPLAKGSLQNGTGLDAVFISEDWTIWPKTFSVWVRIDNYPASDGTIMALESGADFRLGVDSTGHLFFTSGATTATASGTLTVGTWYHVALVAAAGDPASRKIYVDGVEVISTSGNDDSIGTPSLVQFYLANDNGSLNGLECTMAAFHAWNAELTQTEIQADFDANCYELRVVTASTRYWYSMHNAATGLIDGSGNGVLASTSGDFITDYPPDIAWCADECINTQEPGSSGGGTVIMPTTGGGELIGDPLIGESLIG